ncbi:MAG TPA: hypothetical protein VFJ82_00900, partial [Longimicrobium sp.]|nr:hypothetical protein [Longimicrobium sp.]
MQTIPRPATAALYSRPALVRISQGLRRRFLIDLLLIPALMAAVAGGATTAIGTSGQTRDIAVLFALLASPVVGARLTSARVRRLSPQCPACGERLATTGGVLRLRGDDCGSCGTRIIGAGHEPAPVLGTYDTFMERHNALARRYRFWAWTSGGGMVAAGVGAFGMEEGWLPRSLELPVLAAAIVFLAAGFVAFHNGWPSSIRRAGLGCPTCHDPLVGGRGGHITRHTLSTG